MNCDLKIIKKKYGEKMMRFCREFFSTILEKPGVLSKILLDHFSPSHYLYDDIVDQKKQIEFRKSIYSIYEPKIEVKKEVEKTPKELFFEAGYDLYECKTYDDVKRFESYYYEEEVLCTFNDIERRLNKYYIFFAVKRDVDSIKREDFKNPERNDLYGTSVISLQFTKDCIHMLSIKNRYNHSVKDPDAAFSNNLENIKEGLTYSFEKYYGLVQKYGNKDKEIDLKNYVKANDGRYYKYNIEINNIYYCTDNIIIDNFEIKRYDKEKFIIFDYFILDLENKEVKLYDKRLEDTFPQTIKGVEKIQIIKENGYRTIYMSNLDGDNIVIKLGSENEIVEYENNNIIEICNNFLVNSWNLTKLILSNVKKIGANFVFYNTDLYSFYAPQLEEVGEHFLYHNERISILILLKLKKIGKLFMNNDCRLRTFVAPNLQEIDYGSLGNNKFITINEVKEDGVNKIMIKTRTEKNCS